MAKLFVVTAIVAFATLLPAGRASAGVILTQTNPGTLDVGGISQIGAPARIRFINELAYGLDLYWIDYSGNRVLYSTIASGASYDQPTFLTHPWILVRTGTGGTTAQGSGTLIAGYLPVTSVGTTADFDTARITVPFGVPEPATLGLLSLALGAGLLARRRGR